jgi:PIN domain nuclease of toxin-antitoxin system
MARALLDTYAFLWWTEDSNELSRRARQAIADPANQCLLSLASCWEMAIKASLGRLKLPSSVERFVKTHAVKKRIELLPIDLGQLARVEKLPFHHRDPFDRLLVAQALELDLPIVTADRAFKKYGIRLVW